jgi:hypothetical protein
LIPNSISTVLAGIGSLVWQLHKRTRVIINLFIPCMITSKDSFAKRKII